MMQDRPRHLLADRGSETSQGPDGLLEGDRISPKSGIVNFAFKTIWDWISPKRNKVSFDTATTCSLKTYGTPRPTPRVCSRPVSSAFDHPAHPSPLTLGWICGRERPTPQPLGDVGDDPEPEPVLEVPSDDDDDDFDGNEIFYDDDYYSSPESYIGTEDDLEEDLACEWCLKKKTCLRIICDNCGKREARLLVVIFLLLFVSCSHAL